MTNQNIYQEGQEISCVEARRVLGEYLDELDKRWTEMGLPTDGLKERRNSIIHNLVVEMRKVYSLKDC